ncbi:hypothetical protein LVK61_30905, partial [Escherichia coli]|nr:hypothetical protein [Escherichia coli]
STNTFTKHLHEIIFYTPHGCETTTGAFLSEVSPITTKYRRKKEMECQLAYRYTDEMITCIAIHSQVE